MPAHAKPFHRCTWCGTAEIYVRYHDEEWGVPVTDDEALFGKLLLDGAQAGLSWLTILKKRAGYEAAFDGFDPERIARFSDAKLSALRLDAAIVRNRLKIEAFRTNARAYLKLRDDVGSFGRFLWAFVEGHPRDGKCRADSPVQATSAESDAMSRALKAYGFKFVGSTICYAFMQAVGMVNDHAVECFRYGAIKSLGSQVRIP
jgi:DNA-3-methyladenine glycosylase I